LFHCDVQETEGIYGDSPLILNIGLDESGWAKVPTFVTQSLALSEIQSRSTSPYVKILDLWLNVMPKM